jgi:heptosyltransferase-2
VLVRLPSWLGDVVMAEPALRALAEHAGEDALTLVGLGPHLELLAPCFPRARTLALAARDLDEPRAWRGLAVAVLFTVSFRSAWTASRAGIPRRAGFARDGRGWLLSDALAPA